MIKPNTCTNVMRAERPQLYLQQRFRNASHPNRERNANIVEMKLEGEAPAFVRLVHEAEKSKPRSQWKEDTCKASRKCAIIR